MSNAPFDPNPLRLALATLGVGGDAALQDQQLPDALLQGYRRYYGLTEDALGVPSTSHFGLFTTPSERLAYQVWQPMAPARGSLLLVHGYYDHMGLYRHLIAWALGLGFSVLACDLPGHGLSTGRPASIGSFADYQEALKALLRQAERLHLPAPWHLCGQSMGGAIALDYLLGGEVRDEVGQTLLLAPLVRPRAWRRSKMTYLLVRAFLRQIPRNFSQNSNDAEFLQFVAKDPLQPRILPTAWVGALARWIPNIESAMPSGRRPLVVQGDADQTVDWRFNLKVLQQKFDAPKVLLLPGARHHLANETLDIRRRYLAFWEQHL